MPELQHQLGHPFGGEDAHQVVFQRQIKARRSRIALAAGPATKLIVDAAAFMALGADDMQAAGRDDLLLVLFAVGLDLSKISSFRVSGRFSSR